LQSPAAARFGRVLRYALTAGILVYLVYRLSTIGWAEIWRSLPVTPWFYLIFIGMYLALPVMDSLAYRLSWHFPFWTGLPAFLKKRVYNKDVLGYSGEVYLYAWAKKHLSLSEREILGTVKDNTIVSSVASTFFAVTVLVVLFFSGSIALDGLLTPTNTGYAILGALAVTALVALAVRFRRVLFRVSGRTMVAIFLLHVTRLTLVSLLQVLQWSVVLPDVELRVWLTFFAVQLVTSRIPFLPSRDLIFFGASVELSRILDVSSAGIAGMMLVASVLDKSVNFVLFLTLSLFDRRKAPNSVPLQHAPIGNKVSEDEPDAGPISALA
jgi:hypothetical protein